jgi:hypothetical protein
MSLPEERPSFKEHWFPVGMTQLGLAASFITPSSKKNDGNGNQFVDDKPFINDRKPSRTTVVKNILNIGEHMLIPVMAKISFCRMGFQKVCFERRPTVSHG